MNENKTNKIKLPLNKKIMVICIIIAVVLYCFPEIKDKIISSIDIKKFKRRKER